MSAVNLKHDKYEAAKVNLLLRQVQNANEKGQGQEYEILVDDFVVVPRTADPELFNSYADYISSESKALTIILYKGTSKSFDKYFFHINGLPKKEENLQGIPDGLTVSEWEEKQKDKWKKEMRYDELEKENSALKTQLAEKNKSLEESTEKFGKLKDGKLLGFSEIGSSVIMGLIRHPKVQEQFPVLQGFSDTEIKIVPQENATFVRKGEQQNNEEEKEQIAEVLSVDEYGYLLVIRELKQGLSSAQLENVLHILGQLAKCPPAIGSTLKHISNFLNSKPIKKEETDHEEV